jgi:hypothetical protein
MYFVITSKEQRAKAAEYVAKLRANPIMIVEVKEYKKNRSTSQNRLLWMWYGIIAKDQGNTPEELHEAMKVRVLGVERKVVAGQELIMPKSSTKLTTAEMTSFLEAIEALARQLNIILPRPDDYMYAMGY